MTTTDRAPFAELMLGLGETYGEPISDARLEIYFAALADLELADVRRAAGLLVRTTKFFPRPVELREACGGGPDGGGSADERADLAWVDLLREVRRVGAYGVWNSNKGATEPPAPNFFDAAAERAALELYGGWSALCASLPGEGPELLGAAKLFKATYRAYANREQRQALPPGETGRELTKGEAAGVLLSLKAALRERGLPTHD